MIKQQLQDNQFNKPIYYRIKVEGDVSPYAHEYLGGMDVEVIRKKDEVPVSVLIGKLKDQAALTGILNTLYEFRFPVLIIEKL